MAETERDRGLRGRVGILCDDRYGQDALNAATGRGWWIGRPTELPGSNPLEFDHGRSVGTALIAWPVEHVVKCLAFYHPDDAIATRLENEAQIAALHDAVQASGHELMLEIIPPKSLPRAPDTVLRAVKRLYNLGIYPEWWKLEPMAPEVWAELDALIAERDPYCRGVVLLGLSRAGRHARAGLPRCPSEHELPRLRGRPHDLRGAGARLARGRDRRRDAEDPRPRDVRDVDRRVAGREAMKTVRLTMAQALVRYLAALRVERPDGARLFAGVFAIFGHGNVAGLGEALYAHRADLPTYRAHNEQAMAHAAIAYAKASMRRRMMACTTSIGPGATNLVTAAATAHVNRLPVLLLPGDVFASRAPDPVLQQVEDFHDGTVSANDCLRPVSRYFDRILHPEQLLTALPRAIHVLTDPALCGPVTLALPQDVQTMAFDCPEAFFAPAPIRFVAMPPAEEERDRSRRGDPRGEAAADRRGRRRALCAGDGRAARVRRRARRPRRGDAGRQGRAAVGPPAAAGRDRRHRRDRRERCGGRGRRGDRGRHAAAGLHHRLALAVRAGAARVDQRQRVRRAQVARRAGARRRRSRARGAVAVARRLARRRRVASGRAGARPALARRGIAHHRRARRCRCPTTAR